MKPLMVIDGQVFQSGAWHRGMGKYSFELIRSSFEALKNENDRVLLLLNANLKLEHQAREALTGLFGAENVVELKLVLATRDAKKDRLNNKRILNKYFAASFPGCHVRFFILSLFLDNGCAVFPDHSAKFLLFYDSIPFLFPDKYRNRINYDNYLTHYGTVFEADIIFAISQTVADDTVINFGIAENKVVNIDGARIGVPPKHRTMPDALKGVNKFILCPTGDELRKNNLRAVQGFELFNQRNKGEYKLILTSFFGEYTISQLRAVSNNIIFTTNIPFDQLEWLYTNAELILFPSEYEGLGLPILEAVTYGKKIVCSDIPVFREISQDAFYFFDPFNPLHIAQKIGEAIAEPKLSPLSDEGYKRIIKKYTWERTAAVATDAINATVPSEKKSKPKLAILAPSPDGYSAIGKVVAESHASLAEFFDIVYYFEKGPEHRYLRPDFLSKIAESHPVESFNYVEYKKFDAVLYHIGNSEYHLSTISNALVYPGYCIFHDTNLGGAYGLLRTLGYMTDSRIILEQQLDKVTKTRQGKYLHSVASNQKCVIVHSEYAKGAISETVAAPKVVKLNLPVDVPELSRHYKGADSPIEIGLAGIIAGIKGIELIEQLAVSEDITDVNINIFGYLQSEVIKDQLKRLANVTLVTNPTDFEFQNLLAKLDILLNFRMQYQGETSLTVLEAMRHGVVVIVRDIGWYAELPADVVVKVATKEEAIAAVTELANNRAKIQTISEAAKTYVKKNYSHLGYAKDIHAMITGDTTIDSTTDKLASFMMRKTPTKRELINYMKTLYTRTSH